MDPAARSVHVEPGSVATDRPAWRIAGGLALVAVALTVDLWLPPVLGFVKVILGVSGLVQLGKGVRAVVLARRPGPAPATYDRVVRRTALGFLVVVLSAGAVLLGWLEVDAYRTGSSGDLGSWWSQLLLGVLPLGCAGFAVHTARAWWRAGR